MKNIVVYFYYRIPKNIRYKIGKTKALKVFRDFILRKNGVYKESGVHINRRYNDYEVSFKFYGSIKVASKALQSGIENKMLRNSMQLIHNCTNDLKDLVILDVGANFGYLSLVWAKSICKSGSVISFEPNINVYNTLSKSINENKLQHIIKAENLAVGNENKLIELYMNDSTSNTINSNSNNSINTVKMVKVDSYVKENQLSKCDLIKIDVDGIEYDILKGCINTLKTIKPIFIVETNNDNKIVTFFLENDYKVLNSDLKEYSPQEVLPLNIFCIPKYN